MKAESYKGNFQITDARCGNYKLIGPPNRYLVPIGEDEKREEIFYILLSWKNKDAAFKLINKALTY